jgi:hypothetical protein
MLVTLPLGFIDQIVPMVEKHEYVLLCKKLVAVVMDGSGLVGE